MHSLTIQLLWDCIPSHSTRVRPFVTICPKGRNIMGEPLLTVTSMGNMGPGQQRPECHHWRARSCPGPTTVEVVLPITYAPVHALECPTDNGLEVAQGVAQAGLLAALELRRAVRQEGSAGAAHCPSRQSETCRRKTARKRNRFAHETPRARLSTTRVNSITNPPTLILSNSHKIWAHDNKDRSAIIGMPDLAQAPPL
jgi:hypothetical protein